MQKLILAIIILFMSCTTTNFSKNEHTTKNFNTLAWAELQVDGTLLVKTYVTLNGFAKVFINGKYSKTVKDKEVQSVEVVKKISNMCRLYSSPDILEDEEVHKLYEIWNRSYKK